MATSVFSSVDEYGFKRPEEFDYASYEQFMDSYFIVLANRSRKWKILMEDNKALKKGARLKRYVMKGIPFDYRPEGMLQYFISRLEPSIQNDLDIGYVPKSYLCPFVWMTISNANALKERYGPSLYSECLSRVIDSEVVQSIRVDLPRTFPDNIHFVPEGELVRQLDRVLYAYAANNKNVGYCQGMNYIVGLLLLVTKNENSSFWMLKTLIETVLPSDYYTRNMKGLKTDMDVFELLMKRKMSQLYKHTKSLNIPWSCLIMKWLICVYAEVLPVETVLRVWDRMFYDGSKILFKVGLTLIKYNEKSLIACDSFVSFTDRFKKMQYEMFVLDCHGFMKRVYEENKFLTSKKLQELRTEVRNKKHRN